MNPCEHVETVRAVSPSAEGCEECLASGDRWVQLRMCLHCGHVGCCDNSKNRHATRHYLASRHPVMRSFKAGKDWVWCYPDERFLDVADVEARLNESPPAWSTT